MSGKQKRKARGENENVINEVSFSEGEDCFMRGNTDSRSGWPNGSKHWYLVRESLEVSETRDSLKIVLFQGEKDMLEGEDVLCVPSDRIKMNVAQLV